MVVGDCMHVPLQMCKLGHPETPDYCTECNLLWIAILHYGTHMQTKKVSWTCIYEYLVGTSR